MAGDWIKMRVDLADDPAVIGIAERLDLDEDTVVGKLHRLWSWADRHTVDGNAPSVTEKWLDRYVSATGFASAMQSVGWLQIGDGNIQLPDFDKHNGQTGKSRALTNRRVSKSRSKCNADSNGASVTKALPEKRREEKSNTPHKPPRGGVPQWLDEAFNRWWLSYPKKVSKQNAVRAYPKAIKKIESGEGVPRDRAVEILQEAVEAFAASDAGKGDYVPHPATWLNGGRWEDDRATWKDSAGSKPVSERVPRIEDYQNGHMWNPHE